MTADELRALLDAEIAEAEDRIEAYEERSSLVAESLEDGKTTDQRAIEALERPERFHGEHQVANAWLQNSETARIFKSGE